MIKINIRKWAGVGGTILPSKATSAIRPRVRRGGGGGKIIKNDIRNWAEHTIKSSNATAGIELLVCVRCVCVLWMEGVVGGYSTTTTTTKQTNKKHAIK